MNISILLPFKENFSKSMAGAVSLFVKDTSNLSSFRNNINNFWFNKKKRLFIKKLYKFKYQKKIF